GEAKMVWLTENAVPVGFSAPSSCRGSLSSTQEIGSLRPAFGRISRRHSGGTRARFETARDTVVRLTRSRRATSRTEERGGGLGNSPRARTRIELFRMPMRGDDQRCRSESVQQSCSKLLSNAGESELGPTIAGLSFSEENRGLPKLATLCRP